MIGMTSEAIFGMMLWMRKLSLDDATPQAQPETTPPKMMPQPVAEGSNVNPQLTAFQASQNALHRRLMDYRRRLNQDNMTQNRRIFFQGVMALGGSVVMVLAFVFLVLPIMIRFAGNLGNLANFTQGDQIPPRVPVYSAPPAATQDSSINLTGFGEPKSEVVIVNNGRESTRSVVSDEGDFSLSLELDEGENKFSAYGIDPAGNESGLGKEYIVLFDREAPEVEWESPEDGKTITNLRERTVAVKGKVNETAKVTLNDRFVSVDTEGNFSTNFELQQGENVLLLKVTDQAGNEVEIERKVNFRP